MPRPTTRIFVLIAFLLGSFACSKVAPVRGEPSSSATGVTASSLASAAALEPPFSGGAILAGPTGSTPSPPHAAAPLEQAVDAFYAITDYHDVSISPDGSHVAWVASALDNGQPSRNSVIQVIDRTTLHGESRRVTALASPGAPGTPGARMERGVTWSPDSQTLAFLSDAAESKQLQLYTYHRQTGAVTQLTKLHGYLKDPVYSPDGRSIAVLFTEGASRPTGALEAIPVPTGLVDSKFEEQRIAIVDIASHAVRVVSPPDTYVYEQNWSPDSKRIAAVAARGHGESQWWVAELYLLDVATGDFRSLYKPPRQIAVPRFSPDGAEIAIIGGLMSDEGVDGGDIFVVSAQTGRARNVTPDRKSSPRWMTWLPGENRLLLTEIVEGRAAIASLDTASGRSETLYTGDDTLAAQHGGLSLSVAADGKTMAVARQSFVRAEDVVAGPIGAWQALTHTGEAVKPWWGRAESLHFTSDGRKIQGWLVYPRDFDAGKKYPMVVSVHGGPASAVLPGFKEGALFGLEGYFVFFPNPRGSYGAGEAFTQANVKDFGHGDLRDILAGVDEALKTAPIDKNRLAITGWSYGGYMTMWAITQTNRFRAAAAGAGISNWQSYYGQNEIREWMIPYFGASVYDDPAVYAKSSPIQYIKKAATPTLVVVGDSDGECPAAQSFEFFRALKAVGVDTQLMVYPHEGHRFMKPEHRRDRMLRTATWFNAKLNPPSGVPSSDR